MPNLKDLLKDLFSRKSKLQDVFKRLKEEQEEQEEQPAAEPTAVAVPLAEEEQAAAEPMPEAQAASPEKITELLNLVHKSNKQYLSKGGLEAEIDAEEEASATLVKVSEGLHQLIDLNVIAAVTFELKGQYASQYATFSASLKAFAKASLEFNVDFMNIKKGVIIDTNFNLEARAAATATASAEIKTFQIGELGGTVGACAEAYAIAEASVSGTFKIGKEGIAIGANVKLGATAGVSFEGSATVAFKGTTVFKVSHKMEASVGAGAEFGGTFSFENGLLKINWDAGLTVGFGATVHESVVIDFAAIKECIKVELEVLGAELKEKINVHLRAKMDQIIKELEAAGAADIAQPLLNRTKHIDSELYSEDETLNLQFLRTNRNSPWEALKRVKYAGKDAKLVALQEIIERCISLTNKK